MLQRLLSPSWLYRACAVVFFLYALGHTVGFLSFSAPTGAGRAVFADMTAVSFDVEGRRFSYGDFYQGFGLMITVYKLFCAFIAFHLGHLAANGKAGVRGLGWAMTVLQCSGLVLCLRYFGTPPAALSALLVLMLAAATVRAKPVEAAGIAAASQA